MAAETRRLLDMIALLGLESFAAIPVRILCTNLVGLDKLTPLMLQYIRSLIFESSLCEFYIRWVKDGVYRQLEWSRVSDQSRTETSFITTLLDSVLDTHPPAMECRSNYNRSFLAGQPVLLQKSKSQFRLVDSGSSSLTPSPKEIASPTNAAVAEPGFGHGDFSSANSSSSGSVNTTVASDTVGPLVGSLATESVAQDLPPLSIAAVKRGKNPLAACQEVITTPHPRVSDIISYLPRVPSLDETLDSHLLRKMFEDYYLFPRLVDETERELWRNLRDYAASFAHLSDEDVSAQQPELRARALAILDTYPSYLRKQPFLKSRINNECFVTIRFFREEEKFLYGQAHQSYESLLEKSGWLRM